MHFLHIVPSWLQLLALAFCSGIVISYLWLFDASANRTLSADRISVRLRLLFIAGIAAIVVCSIADLLIAAAEMSGGPISEAIPMLPAVVSKTHFGRVWLIRMASLVLLSVAT